MTPPAKDVATALAAGRVVHLDGRGATVSEALVGRWSCGDLVGGLVLVAVSGDASADAVVHKFTLAGAGGGRRHGVKVRALLLGRLRQRGESKKKHSCILQLQRRSTAAGNARQLDAKLVGKTRRTGAGASLQPKDVPIWLPPPGGAWRRVEERPVLWSWMR